MATKSHNLLRFLVTDPKFFLNAPLARICTNIEGGARAEKTQFFSRFIQNYASGAEILANTGIFLVLWQSLKN